MGNPLNGYRFDSKTLPLQNKEDSPMEEATNSFYVGSIQSSKQSTKKNSVNSSKKVNKSVVKTDSADAVKGNGITGPNPLNGYGYDARTLPLITKKQELARELTHNRIVDADQYKKIATNQKDIKELEEEVEKGKIIIISGDDVE